MSHDQQTFTNSLVSVASCKCFNKGYKVKHKVSKFQKMELKNEVFLLVYERGKSLVSITRKEEGTIIDVRIRGSPNFVLQILWTSVFVCGLRYQEHLYQMRNWSMLWRRRKNPLRQKSHDLDKKSLTNFKFQNIFVTAHFILYCHQSLTVSAGNPQN